MNLKLKKAVAAMNEACIQSNKTWELCLDAIRLAVAGGVAKAGLKGDAGNAEHDKLMTWARGIMADHPGSKDAVDNVCRKCASVALVPDAIGVIKQGKGDKASTTEVRAKGIKTRRELSACAEAANKVLGRVKQANSGTTVPEDADDAELDAVSKAEAQAELLKVEAKIAERAAKNSMAIADALRLALDGKHGELRQTVVETLASLGFRLAPVEVKSTEKPAQLPTKPARNTKRVTPAARV